MIVLGRLTTTKDEQYCKVVAPILLIPSGTVIPVNVEDPINGIDDSPVKKANSWNAPLIAELVNLLFPKAFIPWGMCSTEV